MLGRPAQGAPADFRDVHVLSPGRGDRTGGKGPSVCCRVFQIPGEILCAVQQQGVSVLDEQHGKLPGDSRFGLRTRRAVSRSAASAGDRHDRDDHAKRSARTRTADDELCARSLPGNNCNPKGVDYASFNRPGADYRGPGVQR